VSRSRRPVVALVAAALGAALVSGCAAPDFRYAAEKPAGALAGNVYFKVPYTWTAFPTGSITTAQQPWATAGDPQLLLAATSWQEAYDSAPQPSLSHVFGRAAPDRPVVYASLRSLYTEEQPGATPAGLRDLLVPVSTLGRAVRVTTDESLRQGKADGVHMVFSYTSAPGQPEETIDQTAYLSDGTDAVYLLVVRCTTTCYTAHRAEIDSVTSSYTIQEDRSG
jgi:hypothetical protein